MRRSGALGCAARIDDGYRECQRRRIHELERELELCAGHEGCRDIEQHHVLGAGLQAHRRAGRQGDVGELHHAAHAAVQHVIVQLHLPRGGACGAHEAIRRAQVDDRKIRRSGGRSGRCGASPCVRDLERLPVRRGGERREGEGKDHGGGARHGTIHEKRKRIVS